MAKPLNAAIHWFRKGLRLHDNPALVDACLRARRVYPVFVIDPWFAKPDVVGINRYSFLLQSLTDLDSSLRKLGSRLYVVKGKPEQQLPLLVQRWGVQLLTFEKDTEPYAVKRDAAISTEMVKLGIQVRGFASHTLRDMEEYVSASKGAPPISSYASFYKLFSKLGTPRRPVEDLTAAHFASSSGDDGKEAAAAVDHENEFRVPTLSEMGYSGEATTPFAGGETEALKRLNQMVSQRPAWVASFEKPNTSPNALQPSTTVLSPYLKFGCLSASCFYHELDAIYQRSPGKHSQPPVSLHGQLLWREFFYLASVSTPNFGQMMGNPHCRQIPWSQDEDLLSAFKEARTGYPFIDAIMTQLAREGWIHHLARHAVACFLTRGDLWQSWEAGVRIFDLYLLDADWALNNANWQWLSCSNFFYQYFRCYSPVAFGKKTDPNGDYIRKYLPKLARFPAKYIFEPWKAPLSVQKEAGCIIGVVYPAPIVDHDSASKTNMQRMKVAYDASKSSSAANGDGNEDEEEAKSSSAASLSSSSKKTASKASSLSASSSSASKRKQSLISDILQASSEGSKSSNSKKPKGPSST